MLLVAEVYVGEEGAFAWEKSAGDFEGFCVPVFGFSQFLVDVVGGVFFHLEDEADFGGVAEVGDGEGAGFLDEGVSC